MTDLSSLGYPQGYHLGFSFILWSIAILIIAILGIGFYLKARSSDLINIKEMLRAKSFLYICISIQFSLTQVGVLFPDNFLYFYLFGGFFSSFSSGLYFYYWEKHLTSIKRIPTLSAIAAVSVAVITLITSILFSDLTGFVLDFLIFIIISLIAVATVLYVYLIYGFSKNVKGVSTTVGRIWMGGMIFTIASYFLEHPPGVRILPAFIVFYFAPIVLIIGLSMSFYGINKLFGQISSYYAQTQKCAVHRGTIEKGNTIHYCPACGIIYCETCFTQVIKKDGCWNCGKKIDPNIEYDLEIEQVIKSKKVDKPKNNPIKKGKQ